MIEYDWEHSIAYTKFNSVFEMTPRRVHQKTQALNV